MTSVKTIGPSHAYSLNMFFFSVFCLLAQKLQFVEKQTLVTSSRCSYGFKTNIIASFPATHFIAIRFKGKKVYEISEVLNLIFPILRFVVFLPAEKKAKNRVTDVCSKL